MDFASQNLTAGQLNAIVKKLGGEEKALRFLRGELVVKPVDRDWSVWKTVKLGTGPKTADDFRKAIRDKGMRIDDYANDILGKPQFTVAAEETEVDLVVVSVAELGFKNGAKREDNYARAQEFGLQRCPSEVGPQLHLQYTDQPKGEWLIIGMEPITASDGVLGLFCVERNDDGLWLNGYYGGPDGFWHGNGRFVFVLPRK